MRHVLLDTSVVLKWFHHEGEMEVVEAEWHLHSHRQGVIAAHLLDLGIYKLGNVLARPLNRTAQQCAAVLEAALALCGPALTLTAQDFKVAAEVASKHGLTFYDEAFVAAARAYDCVLISADRQLLNSGHATSLTDSIAQLRDGR